MRPDEHKKYGKLSTAGKAAYAADLNAESTSNPVGAHPGSMQKLLNGDYDHL